MSSTLFFFLRIDLAIWVLLWFHINVRIVFYTSVKKKNAIRVLIGITLN